MISCFFAYCILIPSPSGPGHANFPQGLANIGGKAEETRVTSLLFGLSRYISLYDFSSKKTSLRSTKILAARIASVSGQVALFRPFVFFFFFHGALCACVPGGQYVSDGFGKVYRYGC